MLLLLLLEEEKRLLRPLVGGLIANARTTDLFDELVDLTALVVLVPRLRVALPIGTAALAHCTLHRSKLHGLRYSIHSTSTTSS